MKNTRIFVIILTCSFLVSCASTTNNENILSSWKGTNVQALISTWGNPSQKIPLGNGNVRYVYTSIQRIQKAPVVTPSYVTVSGRGGNAQVVATPSSVIPGETYPLECTTSFDVNPEGNILSTYSEGNDCRADHNQIKAFGYQ